MAFNDKLELSKQLTNFLASEQKTNFIRFQNLTETNF